MRWKVTGTSAESMRPVTITVEAEDLLDAQQRGADRGLQVSAVMPEVAFEPPPMPPPTVAPPATARRSLWPIATVLVVLILAVPVTVYIVMKQLVEAPKAILDPLARAFKPNVQYTTAITTGISGLKSTPKLIVLTADITAEVTKSKETRVLWGKIYLGTTTVRVRALGNRVQYYVPADSLTVDDFTYNPRTHVLTVRVPPPRLDEGMVEVQSDPSKMEVSTDVGWASLDNLEGNFLRKQAMEELRPAVLREGANELLVDRARSEALKILKDKIFTPLSDALNPDVRVEIEFDRVTPGD